MMVRAHIFISGYVQGVFFRAATQDEARSLRITGWVRNLRDGRVEAVFEGEQTSVEKIISWCHQGPPGASVRNVEVHDEDYTGEFPSFQISYIS